MEHYRKSSHTVYDIKYHIVWITKYRKPVLRADIAQRVRELIREICRVNDVEIIKGHISRDHVHIFVSSAAAYFRESSGSVDQGEDVSQDDDGIQEFESHILGSSHVGSRVFCGQFRQCDGRSNYEIH